MVLTKLVTDTDSFMEQKVTEPGLWREVIALLIVGALGTPGLIYASLAVMDELATGDASQLSFIGIVIRPVAGILILWIATALAVHVVANRVFNTRGAISRVLKTSAWALVPIGVGNLVKTAATYVAFQDFTSDGVPEGADPQEILVAEMDDPIVMIGIVVIILSAIYSGYLLAFAVKHAKDLSWQDATRTAAVPMGAFALYLILTAL